MTCLSDFTVKEPCLTATRNFVPVGLNQEARSARRARPGMPREGRGAPKRYRAVMSGQPLGAPRGVLTGGLVPPDRTPGRAYVSRSASTRGGNMGRDRYSEPSFFFPRRTLRALPASWCAMKEVSTKGVEGGTPDREVLNARGPGLPECVRCVILTPAGAASRSAQRTPPEDDPRSSGTDGSLQEAGEAGIRFVGTSVLPLKGVDRGQFT